MSGAPAAGPPLRVLHATEAMSTGVATFIESIATRQAAAGADVSVLYTVRPETPSRKELERRFPEPVKLLPALCGAKSVANLRRLFDTLRRLAGSGEFDVLHLHSSIAGGVGRLAALTSRPRPLTVYSPHGFAFLRLDASGLSRSGTRLAERALARASGLVLTSGTEVDLARHELGATRVEFLQSGVASETIPPLRQVAAGKRPLVVMLGRMAYQKAPWRFAAIARELSGLADFLWVGGFDSDDRSRWIGDAPVQVLAWASPEELDAILADADVLLFPTLWEGMSLSLIHAQSRGVPAVTTDVVGNRDTVVDGVTGFVCATDAELAAATRRLLTDPELRARMGGAARDHALASLTDDRIGEDSLAIYRKWGRQ